MPAEVNPEWLYRNICGYDTTDYTFTEINDVYYSWSFSPQDLPLVPNDERQVIEDICEQENIICRYGGTTIDMGPNSNIGINHMKIGLILDMEKEPKFSFAFPTYINTLIISETAQLVNSFGAKVVFSGHGGDEGVSHRGDSFELYYHKEYLHFFKCVWDQYAGQKHRLLKTLKQCRY